MSKWPLRIVFALVPAVAVFCTVLLQAEPARANEYIIDQEHTSIHFRIAHFDYSKVQGRFNKIRGAFLFDPDQPEKSKVHVVVDTGSVDTNLATRDRHLRADEYFNVLKFPQAVFKSEKIEITGAKTGKVHGTLTLLGLERPLTLDVTFNRLAKHPFAEKMLKYRDAMVAGFSATTRLRRSDFGMTAGMGEKGDLVELMIEVEGWRRK